MGEGRIKRQRHPQLPISIYNYTAKAQYMNVWTEEERHCRGLIVEDSTGLIIARGPKKFFNYGQPGAPVVDMQTLVRVTPKFDGSLGIFWAYEEVYGIATRGSFMSDQAIHATELVKTQNYSRIVTEALSKAGNETLVSEVIYPENRIVLQYDGKDYLQTLGYVSNESGIIVRRPVSFDLD